MKFIDMKDYKETTYIYFKYYYFYLITIYCTTGLTLDKALFETKKSSLADQPVPLISRRLMTFSQKA